jgi:hypothetical protein
VKQIVIMTSSIMLKKNSAWLRKEGRRFIVGMVGESETENQKSDDGQRFEE